MEDRVKAASVSAQILRAMEFKSVIQNQLRSKQTFPREDRVKATFVSAQIQRKMECKSTIQNRT
jgi:hypothetical protein